MTEAASLGITALHDAGVTGDTIAMLKELLAENRFPIRLYLMLAGGDAALVNEYFARGPTLGLGDGRLTIRAVKAFADGALGSRGAALLEEYADEPGNSGLLLIAPQDLTRLAQRAKAAGFQLATHAIGDRANRMVLDAYEAALGPNPSSRDHRFRVEHAQLLDESDIPRFAELGVIASMQTTHCTSDMPWVPARLGWDRTLESAYVWRKLLDTGAHLANGSDAPVESLNPMLGLYAAVTRQDTAGAPPSGWAPDQRLSREEALRSFTWEGTYASFSENETGSLEVGKRADLVVLSKDVMTVIPSEILTTTADLTMVGGRIVHEQR
jgi:predicted amidohydrolase YtcJ